MTKQEIKTIQTQYNISISSYTVESLSAFGRDRIERTLHVQVGNGRNFRYLNYRLFYIDGKFDCYLYEAYNPITGKVVRKDAMYNLQRKLYKKLKI